MLFCWPFTVLTPELRVFTHGGRDRLSRGPFSLSNRESRVCAQVSVIQTGRSSIYSTSRNPTGQHVCQVEFKQSGVPRERNRFSNFTHNVRKHHTRYGTDIPSCCRCLAAYDSGQNLRSKFRSDSRHGSGVPSLPFAPAKKERRAKSDISVTL